MIDVVDSDGGDDEAVTYDTGVTNMDGTKMARELEAALDFLSQVPGRSAEVEVYRAPAPEAFQKLIRSITDAVGDRGQVTCSDDMSVVRITLPNRSTLDIKKL